MIRRLILSTIAVFAIGAIPICPAAAQTSYTVKDLGFAGSYNEIIPTALNVRGQAAASSEKYGGSPLAALLYDGTRFTVLPDLGGYQSETSRINDAGWVVGYSTTKANARRACVWRNGAVTDLLGKNGSSALGINNLASPQITGYTTAGNTQQAFVWQNGKTTILPFAAGVSINDSGQIAGADTNGPVFWSASTGKVSLRYGSAQGARVDAINSRGLIAGTVWTIDSRGRYSFEAVVWDGPTGTITYDLGPGEATSINLSDAVVVGNIIWDPVNGRRDLNALVNSSVWTLYGAASINDSGQILAAAVLNSDPQRLQHAVLLSPQ